jgi:hypothetical protein
MPAYIIGMFIPSLPKVIAYPTLFLDMLFLFPGMAIILLHMALIFTIQMYLRPWREGVVVEVEGGFSVPTTLISLLFLRTKAVVPYVDIRHARRTSGLVLGTEQYEVVTSTGRRFEVHQSVFRALQRRQEFEEHGFELVNKQPIPEDQSPMLRIDHVRVVTVLVAIALAVALARPTLFALSDEDTSQSADGPVEPGPMDYLMLLIVQAMVVFVLFKFIQVRRLSTIRRLAEDFNVDRSSMNIPRAKEPFRTVRRANVDHIEVRRLGRFAKAPVLWVETSEGTFHLPVELAGELRENGYVVEDPNGLMQGLHDDA